MIIYTAVFLLFLYELEKNALCLCEYLIAQHNAARHAFVKFRFDCRKALLLVWALSVVLALPVVYTNVRISATQSPFLLHKFSR